MMTTVNRPGQRVMLDDLAQRHHVALRIAALVGKIGTASSARAERQPGHDTGEEQRADRDVPPAAIA